MTVQVKSHAFFGKKLLTQETKMISGVTIRESCNDISTRRWVELVICMKWSHLPKKMFGTKNENLALAKIWASTTPNACSFFYFWNQSKIFENNLWLIA